MFATFAIFVVVLFWLRWLRYLHLNWRRVRALHTFYSPLSPSPLISFQCAERLSLILRESMTVHRGYQSTTYLVDCLGQTCVLRPLWPHPNMATFQPTANDTKPSNECRHSRIFPFDRDTPKSLWTKGCSRSKNLGEALQLWATGFQYTKESLAKQPIFAKKGNFESDNDVNNNIIIIVEISIAHPPCKSNYERFLPPCAHC